MQINLSDTDGQTATVLMRVCLSPQEIAKLKERKNPQLIISVFSHEKQKEERRIIVPVEVGAELIVFRNSGKHDIFVAVLDNNNDAGRLLRVDGRRRGYNDYDRDLLNRDYDNDVKPAVIKRSIFDCYKLRIGEDFIEAQVEVDVDPTRFAQPARDERYVHFIFSSGPEDQCHTRKRRWFIAYWVMPFVIFFGYLARLVPTVFFWLIGRKKIMIEASILKPLDFISFPWIDGIEDYSCVTHFDFETRKPIWRTALNWRILLLVGLAVFTVWYNAIPLCLAAKVAGIIIGAFSVAGFLGWFIGSGKINSVIDKIFGDSAYRYKKRKDRFARWAQEDKERLARNLEALNCKLVPEKITLDTLPRKTFHLRFADLKRKVCKPYAGN